MIIKTNTLLYLRQIKSISQKDLDILERRLDLETELKQADRYKKYFKQFCVVYRCKNSIPKTWEWYRQHGNFCRACHARTGKTKLKPEGMKNLYNLFKTHVR